MFGAGIAVGLIALFNLFFWLVLRGKDKPDGRDNGHGATFWGTTDRNGGAGDGGGAG